jgi:hypothetical protein
MDHQIRARLRGPFSDRMERPRLGVVAGLDHRTLESTTGVAEHHDMMRMRDRNREVDAGAGEPPGPDGYGRDANSNWKSGTRRRSFRHGHRSTVGNKVWAGEFLGNQPRLHGTPLAVLAPSRESVCADIGRIQAEQRGAGSRGKEDAQQASAWVRIQGPFQVWPVDPAGGIGLAVIGAAVVLDALSRMAVFLRIEIA